MNDHTTQARLASIHRCTCGSWVYRIPGEPITCQHLKPRQTEEKAA